MMNNIIVHLRLRSSEIETYFCKIPKLRLKNLVWLQVGFTLNILPAATTLQDTWCDQLIVVSHHTTKKQLRKYNFNTFKPSCNKNDFLWLNTISHSKPNSPHMSSIYCKCRSDPDNSSTSFTNTNIQQKENLYDNQSHISASQSDHLGIY